MSDSELSEEFGGDDFDSDIRDLMVPVSSKGKESLKLKHGSSKSKQQPGKFES